MALTARQKELTARHFLAHPDEIGVAMKEKRWEEMIALAEFLQQDAPKSLIYTDPALYRMLRQQITEVQLRGWTFNLRQLRELAKR